MNNEPVGYLFNGRFYRIPLFAHPQKEDEPYFGFCDVEGCENEACSGGSAWRDTGYWRVCHKHAADYRNNKPQPKMKQSAIDRENTRGSDGALPIQNSPETI